MKKLKSEWIWIAYFLIYWLVTTAQIAYFFTPNSALNLYYHYLIAYDLHFLLTYTLNVLVMVFNALSLVPIYLYIYRIEFLTPDFWKTLLILRLTLDLMGRSFEFQVLKAIFQDDPFTAGITVLTFLLFHLPSYMILFLYAFRPKKYYPRSV